MGSPSLEMGQWLGDAIHLSYAKPVGWPKVGEVSDPPDCRLWKPSPTDGFSVQSMYNILRQPKVLACPAQEIWRSKLPSKACFLLWLLLFDKALTLDSLKKCGFHLANRWCLCGLNEESAAYLFLHCHVAFELWGEFLKMFGLAWVFPDSFPKFLDMWFHGQKRAPSQKGVLMWKSTPHVVYWLLCSKRNARVFEDKSSSIQQVKYQAVALLYSMGCDFSAWIFDWSDLIL